MDALTRIGTIFNNLGNLVTSFFNFFVFVCKSFINLIGRFLGQFWGQDFNTYFTSQFGPLSSWIGGYTNYVVIAFTIIVILYFYQFITRRLKGK